MLKRGALWFKFPFLIMILRNLAVQWSRKEWAYGMYFPTKRKKQMFPSVLQHQPAVELEKNNRLESHWPSKSQMEWSVALRVIYSWQSAVWICASFDPVEEKCSKAAWPCSMLAWDLCGRLTWRSSNLRDIRHLPLHLCRSQMAKEQDCLLARTREDMSHPHGTAEFINGIVMQRNYSHGISDTLLSSLIGDQSWKLM